MLMTVRSVAERLLRYLSPEEQAIPPTQEGGVDCYPGRITEALNAINGAMQEMFGKGALHQARRNFGSLIEPPSTVTFNVERGSPYLRFSGSDWKPWMTGCTCRIDGEVVDNQILDYDEATSSLTLVTPYSGDSSGEKVVTVWHDCVKVDEMVGEILSVGLAGSTRLTPVVSPDSFNHSGIDDEDYNFHHERVFLKQTSDRLSNHLGTPLRYFVDTFHRSNQKPERRIRLFPLPEKQEVLKFRARVIPPFFEEGSVHVTIPTSISISAYPGKPPSSLLTWIEAEQAYSIDAGFLRVVAKDGRWVLEGYDATYDVPDTPGPQYEDGPVGVYSHQYKHNGSKFEFAAEVTDSNSVVPLAQPSVALPIHNDWVDSIFFPIAAQRFQACSYFRNDSATDEISRQYSVALELLKTTAPQTKIPVRIRPAY